MFLYIRGPQLQASRAGVLQFLDLTLEAWSWGPLLYMVSGTSQCSLV